ncbi:MAG TPA: hypothetical protein VNJ53_13570 [Gaiellaceae bacterium]|nr:hypothetical protein [Gaiellaceae bacterium]
MRATARVLVALLGLALLAGAPASATHRDPERRIVAADEARARSVLLRRADLGPGYRATPSGAPAHIDCAALDESDLTLAGDAESPTWTRDVSVISSYALVYRTVADANASWRRSTSAAGRRCVGVELRRLVGSAGGRLVSLRVLAFPRLAPRTTAFRLDFELQARGPRFTIDLIVLQRARVQAYFYVGSALVPPVRAEEVRLARLVAARLAQAARGA